MRILIDGYNLIRRVPELAGADRRDLAEGREMLLSQLAMYRSGRGHRITVVFDGTDSIHLGGSAHRARGISVVFSPRGRTADDVIRKLCVDGAADLVVTADRQILDTAVRHEVTPMDPVEFWDKVQWEVYSRLKGVTQEDEDSGERSGRRIGRKLKKRDRVNRRRREKV